MLRSANKVSPKEITNNVPTLDDHESQALDKLIPTISSKAVLSLPRPDQSIVIDTDSSEYQVGVASFDIYLDGGCKRIGFWSQPLNAHETDYSVAEKRS